MATTLLPLGQAKYNGIIFTAIIKSRIVHTPRYDKAGRAVAYTEHLWTVEGVVSANTYGTPLTDSTGYVTDGDQSMIQGDINYIRMQLLKPAGDLTIYGHGLGDTILSSASGRQDVLWGPKPERLEIQPFSNKSFFIRYALRWAVPVQCVRPATRILTPMEFNYDWAVAIDKGITTRTITGYMTIPQTRINVDYRWVLRNADLLREKIIPLVPIGFERKQDFKVNYDKNMLTFTIVDTELPTQNPLPAGITTADVTNDLTGHGMTGPSGIPTGVLLDWDWTVAGTLTVAPNMPTAWAFAKFMQILASRYNWLENNLGNLSGLPGGTIQAFLLLTPMSFRFSESIFTLSSSFSATYRVRAMTNFRTVLFASGLWRPIDGTSHIAWNYSMLPAAHAPRGRADLSLPANADVIVDLCETNYPVLQVGQPSLNYTSAQPGPIPCPDLNTQNSWMGWKNDLKTQIQGGRIYHKPIGIGLQQVEQVKHDDDYTIVMTGWAQRILYKIYTPQLISVNGRKVKLIGHNEIENDVIGWWCGWPIYFSRWRLVYKLDKAPVPPTDSKTGQLISIPNPYFNTPGEAGVADQAQP